MRTTLGVLLWKFLRSFDMTTYKLLSLTDDTGNKCVAGVLKDGYLSIPFDPANTDYQAYLTWCAEGNEPLPADEPTPS